MCTRRPRSRRSVNFRIEIINLSSCVCEFDERFCLFNKTQLSIRTIRTAFVSHGKRQTLVPKTILIGANKIRVRTSALIVRVRETRVFKRN